MTGRFIYGFERITCSTMRWADVYKLMKADARHTGKDVFCEVCICGHHSYCLRVTPDGDTYRIYTHLRGGKNGTQERVFPMHS